MFVDGLLAVKYDAWKTVKHNCVQSESERLPEYNLCKVDGKLYGDEYHRMWISVLKAGEFNRSEKEPAYHNS